VDLRVGLDAVEERKILHCWVSNPVLSASVPQLYRLRYLNSLKFIMHKRNTIIKLEITGFV
jgi:hypothetical protein